ncbi:retrovirus-related pol polyprotein from transposon TNT 1-94 [Tanacetum coccineum]
MSTPTQCCDIGVWYCGSQYAKRGVTVVLRILGGIFTSVYAMVQKLKDSWLELQFSLADNSKLNVDLSDNKVVSEPMVYKNPFKAKSTWDDLILYHEGPFDVKESRVMDLKLFYNTFKFKEDSELASLFDKLKYEENLIDSIYETGKNKSLVSVTPLSTTFLSSSIVQDFQDSPDDEEDTRSSQEYLNDLEEEYQARALLAKYKRFFKKGTQRFNSTKATDQTECTNVARKGHFAMRTLEEVSSNDNEMVEVKVLVALAEENNAVGKESPRNGEWVKISMRKCDIRNPIWYLDNGCSMHMTGVKDVYVLDMTSSAQESCFFAKAFENLNWLWHKRLAHLNFKTINKLTKQNLVIGLPSLVYSKDKPCSSCEKGKHHKANFKTKETSSIKKCLHLPHMYLFGPVTPRSINHEKYTLVIVDEYSRNNILVNFCDEKGISQNFSSPYTPEQNGVAERKNRTLIEAARIMLSGSIIPNINFLHVFGCPVYIHNYKDHLGKFDEKADDGYLLGYSLVSKAFRVFNTRRQQLKKPITSHLMKALRLSNSQNLQLTTSTLLKQNDIYLMNIFILMNLLKDFLSKEEPKKVSEALKHPGWVDAMQDELN